MGKNKGAKAAAATSNGTSKDVRVTKATETPKAIAKATKPDIKKKVKEPSPSSESESEDSDASSAEKDSEVSSDSEDETAGLAKNGHKAAMNGGGSESSDSESDDDSADDVAVPKATVSATIVDDAEDSEGSSSDTKAGVTTNAKSNGAKVHDDSESSDSDSSGSSESSDSDDEDVSEKKAAAPVPAKKRKAEAEEVPVAKKTKTASATGSQNAPSKNLFVGNLSWNVDEEWLRTEFAEYGELAGVRIITDRESGRSKGFGYVEFNNEDDAVNAQKGKHEADLDGRALNVDFSTPRDNDRSNGAPRQDRVNSRANKFGDSASVPSDTLFVGNISFSATAELFQETFGEYGNITRVALPTDQDSGALKGFGYVGFTSVEEAQAAMEALNGADIAGRAVRLDFATARTNDGGSRGGFRGGRGGGDRGGRGRGNFRGGRGDSRGGRGDFRGGRGGFRGGDRGGRGGRGGSSNRGGVGDFSGKKVTF